MKKIYTPPTIEKLAFRYRDQVVAASSGYETVDEATQAWNSNAWLQQIFGTLEAWLKSLFG